MLIRATFPGVSSFYKAEQMVKSKNLLLAMFHCLITTICLPRRMLVELCSAVLLEEGRNPADVGHFYFESD